MGSLDVEISVKILVGPFVNWRFSPVAESEPNPDAVSTISNAVGSGGTLVSLSSISVV